MFTRKSLILHDSFSSLSSVNSPQIAPLIGAGLIAGAGSLLSGLFSGLFGSSSAANTNATNLAIARMNQQSIRETNRSNERSVESTNENNRLMQQMANDNNIQLQNDMNAFNQAMWRANNEYNSPAQQMKRALAAGINPNIVFGQPVASSPVQQTSIPSQGVSSDIPFTKSAELLNYNANDKGSVRLIEGISHALEGVSKMPFIKEQLESMQSDNALKREDLKAKEYDNLMKEKDLQDRNNVENLYKSMSLVQNVNDPNDLITPDEYDLLSDDDKKKYNTTDVNGQPLPNLLKAGFKSRAAFEAWKDIRNIPNFLQNIKTDLTQSRLRYLVDSKKIQSDDAINALVHMDNAQYNRILYSVKQIKQDLKFNSETWNDRKRIVKGSADKIEGENKFSDETFQIRKHILEMSDQEAENKVDRNVLTLARQFFGDGKLTAGECAKLLLLKASGFVE